MRVHQHVVVVLVPACGGGVLGNLRNKAAAQHVVLLVSRIRVEVARKHVHRRGLGLLAWLERLLHAVLARVGRRVVAQQRGDLAVARVDALRGRQVHARDHKVAVGRVGKAWVVQQHLQRRVVQLGRAHLAQRVPALKLQRALEEAHVHLGPGAHQLAVLARLLRVDRRPVAPLLRRDVQHVGKGLDLLVHDLFGAGHLLQHDDVKVGHARCKREPLLRQLGTLVRALVLFARVVVARLGVRLVGAAEAHLARVEAADAQPVVRVHRDRLGLLGGLRVIVAAFLERGRPCRGGQLHERREARVAVLLGRLLLLRKRLGRRRANGHRLRLLADFLGKHRVKGLRGLRQLLVHRHGARRGARFRGLRVVLLVRLVLGRGRGQGRRKAGGLLLLLARCAGPLNRLRARRRLRRDHGRVGARNALLQRKNRVDVGLARARERLGGHAVLFRQQAVQPVELFVVQPRKLVLAHVAQVARDPVVHFGGGHPGTRVWHKT